MEIYWESIFLWAQLGAVSEAHLGAISEAHLGSSLGVNFRVFWGPSWDPIGGPSGAGGLFGGQFLRLYNGHSRSRFGGVHWGPFWVPFLVFFGAFLRSCFMEFYI